MTKDRDVDLEQGLALANAATEPPWAVVREYSASRGVEWRDVVGPDSVVLLGCDVVDAPPGTRTRVIRNAVNDGNFVVWARANVPALIRRVYQLEGDRRALAAELQKLRDGAVSHQLGESERLVPIDNPAPWGALLDAAARNSLASTPPPPVEGDPHAATVEAIYQRVKREVSEELERVAPWLYEPEGPPMDVACAFCGMKAIRYYGLPFKIGRDTYYRHRHRCTRCGTSGTSTNAPPEKRGE